MPLQTKIYQFYKIMKVLRSSLFRALCAIIIGALLIQYTQDMMQWLTIAIGAIFLISGVISVATYISQKKQYEQNSVQVFDANGRQLTGIRPQFPLVGFGSIILGIILMFMPVSFINGMMYILAAVLILAAINIFMTLGAYSRAFHIGAFFWIMPALILLAGIFVMVHPGESAATSLTIIGWCMIVYGIVECINAIKLHQIKKQLRQNEAMKHKEAAQEESAEATQDQEITSE